jgi:hypothetical protein
MRTWNRVAGRFDRERGELHVRSWIALGGWIIYLGRNIINDIIVSSSEEIIQMFFALLLAYCLQGCLAELIGVRMGSSGISFPNRLFPSFPYLVLFRKNLRREASHKIFKRYVSWSLDYNIALINPRTRSPYLWRLFMAATLSGGV